MPVKEKDVRKEIIRYAQKLNPAGLNINKSGNVSQRFRRGFLITPTGIPYDELVPEDLVYIRLKDGEWCFDGSRLPSSEWSLHANLYQEREDRNAVVHTHSLYATALACVDEPIPCFHYMVAAAGGKEIPCAPYALFGSEALAQSCASALKRVDACLLSHHGVVALGKNLRKAFELAAEVENLAHMWIEVRKIDSSKILTDEQMDEVLERFKTYGQQKKS